MGTCAPEAHGREVRGRERGNLPARKNAERRHGTKEKGKNKDPQGGFRRERREKEYPEGRVQEKDAWESKGKRKTAEKLTTTRFWVWDGEWMETREGEEMAKGEWMAVKLMEGCACKAMEGEWMGEWLEKVTGRGAANHVKAGPSRRRQISVGVGVSKCSARASVSMQPRCTCASGVCMGLRG